MVFDEYGRPFIILRESTQERVKGIEAQKQHILAARSIANILKTSLGPKGSLLFSFFSINNKQKTKNKKRKKSKKKAKK